MGRSEYNSVNFFALMLLLAANAVLVSPLFLSPPVDPVTWETFPLGWNAWIAGVLMIFALWIAVSSGVRRLHDLGWSGWWMALVLSPLKFFTIFAGVLGLLILAFWRGARGRNTYGESP